MSARRLAVAILASIGLVAASAAPALAQRGGRGGGDSGGGGSAKLSRLELMTRAFKLDDDQQKSFKAAFDEGLKNAATARQALITTHAAIGAAIQGGKPQADIDTAVMDYGKQAAEMTSVEVKALAAAMKSLHPDQLGNKAAVEQVLGILHGAFLDKSKWDIVPDGRTY